MAPSAGLITSIHLAQVTRYSRPVREWGSNRQRFKDMERNLLMQFNAGEVQRGRYE